MPFRSFVSQIAVKLESSWTAPANTDVFAVNNANFTYDVKLTDRNDITGNFMKFPGIPGQRMGKITFDVYLKGSGSAGTAPEFGDALKACRMNETVAASTSVTYKPLVSETSVASVSYYEDGLLMAIAGAIGTVSFKGTVGEPIVASFEFTGLLVDPTDTALISSVTYDSTVPPALQNSTITLLGVTTGICKSLNFDLGNKISMRDSIAAASGYAGAFHSDRRSTGSFEIEMPTIAAHDLWTKLKTPTTGVISNGAIGAAGNLVQLLANVGSLNKLSKGAQDGRSMVTGDFLCGRSGATTEGDDIKLIFT